MSSSLQSILKKSEPGHLFQVKRRLRDVGNTTGFIVAFSDSLILFHTLDKDTFRLNGYTVVREEDLTQYRVFSKAEFWQFRAVKHFQVKAGTTRRYFRELNA